MEMTPNQLKDQILDLVRLQACEWGRDAVDAFMFDLMDELDKLHDDLTTFNPAED